MNMIVLKVKIIELLTKKNLIIYVYVNSIAQYLQYRHWPEEAISVTHLYYAFQEARAQLSQSKL